MKFNLVLSDRYWNVILTGFFLICFSIDAFLIFGDYGKYVSLFGGFGLLLFSYRQVETSKKNVRFFFISTLMYIIFQFLAYLNQQDVFGMTDVIFGIICLVLLNLGYGYSGYLRSIGDVEISKFLTWSIPAVSVIGVFYLIRFQSEVVYDVGVNTRGYGDESDLNPVGVAYVHGLLFIINFAVFYKSVNFSFAKKVLYCISLVALLIAIVTTLSRASLLFVCAYVIYMLISQFELNRNSISKFFVMMLLIFLFGSLTIRLGNNIPVLEEKFEDFSKRVSGLFDFIDSSDGDVSSEERLKGYQYFYENLDEIFAKGMNKYSSYPHNQFIEIIMRWGLFGLPLLLFSVFTITKVVYNFRVYLSAINTVGFVIISLFIFSYFQSMTSLSLEMNRMMWLGMGFVYGLPRYHKK